MPAKNRYFSDLRRDQGLVAWQPPDGGAAGVGPFFALAMEEVGRALGGLGLTFIFTANFRTLPEYGPKVIAFVMSEENGLVPTYTGRVGAVFKCYGARPHFFRVPAFSNPALALPCLARNLKTSVKWLLSYAKWKGAAPAGAKIKVHHIPLGYHSRPKPMPAFRDRPWDVFFAGSIRHDVQEKCWRLKNPKEISRGQLLQAVGRLRERHPNIRLRLLTSQGFVPHAVAWGFVEPSSVFSEHDYMTEMGNAKICLSPRGTSCETFRHFEAAAMGTVVICEDLPSSYFYNDAPFLRVTNWRELDGLLPKLLADPAGLEKRHRDTLAWWRRHGEPASLARVILDALKADGVIQ